MEKEIKDKILNAVKEKEIKIIIVEQHTSSLLVITPIEEIAIEQVENKNRFLLVLFNLLANHGWEHYNSLKFVRGDGYTRYEYFLKRKNG